jgi:hypothetical protein
VVPPIPAFTKLFKFFHFSTKGLKFDIFSTKSSSISEHFQHINKHFSTKNSPAALVIALTQGSQQNFRRKFLSIFRLKMNVFQQLLCNLLNNMVLGTKNCSKRGEGNFFTPRGCVF